MKTIAIDPRRCSLVWEVPNRESLEAAVHQVRKEYAVKFTTKPDALKVQRSAAKEWGYSFALLPADGGYMLVDIDD